MLCSAFLISVNVCGFASPNQPLFVGWLSQKASPGDHDFFLHGHLSFASIASCQGCFCGRRLFRSSVPFSHPPENVKCILVLTPPKGGEGSSVVENAVIGSSRARLTTRVLSVRRRYASCLDLRCPLYGEERSDDPRSCGSCPPRLVSPLINATPFLPNDSSSPLCLTVFSSPTISGTSTSDSFVTRGTFTSLDYYISHTY